MGLEQKINYQLNKIPGIKKVIKKAYQLTMYAVSPKLKSEGNIECISPDDGKEYFFGYYDKSPWDSTGRYVLCMKANNTWSDVSPRETADIILIDTQDGNSYKKLAETRSWNVQQASMLQWLGPDFSSKIIFNDFREGEYVSVIKEISTGNEQVISSAVYSVSKDGKTALSLDFSRLYSLRPGYGYYNIPEKTKGICLPDTTAVSVIDLESGKTKPLLKYTDFAAFQQRKEMLEKGAVHKINHLMLSPNGKRFMVLYRWFIGSRKYTRLITCNIDGSDMFLLNDDDMTSHCCWKSDDEILAFENKKDSGPGYYLMKDRSNEYRHLWPEYSNDGHPSYSPDRQFVITDSYPDKHRIADIKLLKETESKGKVIARVFAPFKYDNDTRCDLHPRWSRDGKKICFDSVFEGHRGLYVIKLDFENKIEISKNGDLVSCIIPTYKRCDTLIRAIDSVLAQTYSNIEVLVIDDNEPGSPENDEVKNLLLRYENDSRVRYIAQEKHINGAVARNKGIAAAKGVYIGFLDDDDEWLPDKVEKQVRYLSEHNDVDGVSCLYRMYMNGKEVRKCKPYGGDNLQFKILSREVAVCTPTFLCRKEAIERSKGFDTQLIRHQDLQMFIDFLSFGKIEPLNEYLVKIHNDSEINRPDLQRIIRVKKDFFVSVEPALAKYSKYEQKRIMSAHYFEVVFCALRQKKIDTALTYAIKVGFFPRAYVDLYKRYRSRK